MVLYSVIIGGGEVPFDSKTGTPMSFPLWDSTLLEVKEAKSFTVK
ncbi:MAG: hypothetical protein WKF36_01345 [Candidatus Nitrosocosmicus sp.]